MSSQPFAQGHGGSGGDVRVPEIELPRPRTSPTGRAGLGGLRCGASARLFIPYRLRLGLLLGLIVLGSVLSVASPFLLREAVDKGIVGHDLTLLSGWSPG